jgi:hypothetical protein
MEARMETRRSAALPILVVLAVVAALLIGATFGYIAKPAAAAVGSTRYIVVTTDQVSPDAYGCQFRSGHKGC